MFGTTEILILATLLLILLMWWLWPRHDKIDLTAPPKDYSKKYVAPETDDDPTQAGSTENEPVTVRSIAPSNNNAVKNEADYSEEDLMMRDVRAALHRGAVKEAIRRVRRTRKMTEIEAMHFIDRIQLPAGHGNI